MKNLTKQIKLIDKVYKDVINDVNKLYYNYFNSSLPELHLHSLEFSGDQLVIYFTDGFMCGDTITLYETEFWMYENQLFETIHKIKKEQIIKIIEKEKASESALRKHIKKKSWKNYFGF